MNTDASPLRASAEGVDLLFAVVSLGTGGMERRCLLLANALVERGWRVAILTLKPTAEMVAAVDPRVQFFTVDLSARKLSAWVRLLGLLRSLRPRAYQGFGSLAGFPVAVLANLAGIPVVINAFSTPPGNYPSWVGPFGRLCFLFTDHAVANSSSLRADYIHEWRLPAGKMTTIPNPVDVSAWPCRDATVRAEVRADLGLHDEQLAIGFVGRLFDRKGHKDLLDAFARVASERPEAVVLLIGEGPLLGELTAHAETLKLSGRVRFLGLRHDVPRVLQALDLFCLPSLIEGMPNVVLEAMAAGLAVISTAVSGAVELVVPDETGWVIPVGDVATLADTLREAMQDRARLLAYGEAGRRRVEEKFDLPVIIERYVTLYEALIGEPSSGRGGGAGSSVRVSNEPNSGVIPNKI